MIAHNDKFKKYISKGYYEVEGWCPINFLKFAALLKQVQEDVGIKIQGGAGEIGVHHGKLFIALALLNSGNKHLCIDVFGEQDFNIDRSGKGDRSIFEENLKKHAKGEYVKILQEDSMAIDDIMIDNILRECGKFSMFSVDGCHTVEHTLNDILIAEKLVGRGGVIFVDDYYDPFWPEVQEGVNRYYATQAYKFLPLGFAFKKLALVHASSYNLLIKRIVPIAKKVTGWKLKMTKRFGYDSFSIISS